MTEERASYRPSELRLTEELVRCVYRKVDDLGYTDGTEIFSEEDYDSHLEAFLLQRPAGPLFVFAYGSLIWKPAFEHAGSVRAIARGWRRSFCLKIKRFRGTAEEPGLMMALDKGGQCEGFLQRLHDGKEFGELQKLWRREMTMKPPGNMPRWVEVEGPHGTITAIAFTANSERANYAGNLPIEQTADILAIACGHWGSCADYLRQTVQSLEASGIHDEYLWRLQELVADRIAERLQGL
jgi:glutathione-specific gamma-glutamylcyclotransferase